MLLICSGPDTWHARKKAIELTEAFRAKHDPQSLSTEILQSVDFTSLLNQLASPSLFSPKRFIRCDGLLDSLKIAEVRTLAKRLKDDADQTIVVTVEDGPPSAKVIDEFSEIKCVHYAYPTLDSSAFLRWCTSRAAELGVDANAAVTIARHAQGDTWFAEQELMKKTANPLSVLGEIASEEESAFVVAEDYLTQRQGWRQSLADGKDDQASIVLVSQSRSAVRVADHATTGLHPYAVKKLSQLRIPNVRRSFQRAVAALIGTRQGLANSKESETQL